MADDRLGQEAREWHDLIQEVHEHQPGSDDDAPREESSPDDAPELHVMEEQVRRFRLDDAFERLMATPGGKIVVALIVLILALLALVLIPDWGSDDLETPPDGAAEEVLARPRGPDDAS